VRAPARDLGRAPMCRPDTPAHHRMGCPQRPARTDAASRAASSAALAGGWRRCAKLQTVATGKRLGKLM
jgi:hypothetical protein